MTAAARSSSLAVLLLCAGLLVASPAQATFLGLENGDVVDTIGFTIGSGGGTFVDSTDAVDISGQGDDITTTAGSPGGPEVLTQLSGGAIDVNLDLGAESLKFLGGTFFQYEAELVGRLLETDVQLNSPTGGPDPEQDGRVLVTGEFLSDNVTVTIIFDATFAFAPTFTFGGIFNVTGGDATFLQAFGQVGDLADIIGASSSSIPALNVLLADGWLFSFRDTNLTVCAGQAANTFCADGNVTGLQDFNFSGTGELIPQNPSAFPEPGVFALLGTGLLGLLAIGRRTRI